MSLLPRYARGMNPSVARAAAQHGRTRASGASVAAAAVLGLCMACPSLPPDITAITISPVDADGRPFDASLCRTLAGSSIPVVGVRPGTNPRQGALWLNDIETGRVYITLARGAQNFVLYCATLTRGPRYVIGIHLDDDPSPTLTAVVDAGGTAPVGASQAPSVRAFDGKLVPNRSALSVVRKGYRISLRGGAFPLADVAVDPVSPQVLWPDGTRDLAGVVTIDVEAVARDERSGMGDDG